MNADEAQANPDMVTGIIFVFGTTSRIFSILGPVNHL